MSGENTQYSSNPASDYDFAEINQEADDINEIRTLKDELASIDMSLMLVLNRFPLSDEVIANFSLFQIKYNQLSSLQREDLIKLGISDNKLQDEMIEEFKNLEGQVLEMKPTLDDLDNTPLSSRGKHKPVIMQLQDHLYRMSTLLAAVSFQLGTKSSAATGIVVNQRLCSSEVILDLLGKLSVHTAEMEEIIKILNDPQLLAQSEKDFKNKKQRERSLNCMVVVSAVGLLVAGIYFARRLGLRKVF
ncbi:hypothetical protein PVAND_002577 [Polypedilum vanderplanki]|uniref:Uncharacterized protein n=1 Tax=Polypedilum vanderplanki TaxID=319348 RepID=A0A9J6BRT4_POLVA|nr:hypothetical protein PVAND_002577 [Polypedilum vanderplanki]